MEILWSGDFNDDGSNDSSDNNDDIGADIMDNGEFSNGRVDDIYDNITYFKVLDDDVGRDDLLHRRCWGMTEFFHLELWIEATSSDLDLRGWFAGLSLYAFPL